MMKRALFLLVAIVALGTASGASAQVVPPPPSWFLDQNDPEPFCGYTAFRFGVAQAAHVHLAIWDADLTTVLRLLVDTDLAAGSFQVIWDGRDGQGARLSDGQYPYRLTATVDGVNAFEEASVSHVQCEVSVEPQTWGTLKSLYGRRDPPQG